MDKSTTTHHSQLLRPVVRPGTYQQLLANKEQKVLAYNRVAKDLGALRNGDTVRPELPGNLGKEAMKTKVERCVGTRFFEVVTKDRARYRRNHRHLRRTKEAYQSSKPGLVAEEGTEQLDQQSMSLPEQAQTGHKLSASCMQTNIPSGQEDATNEPAMTSMQPEPRGQPVASPVQGPKMRSGRVVKKPAYLKDYVTGCNQH